MILIGNSWTKKAYKDEIELSTKEKAELYKKMKRPDHSPTKQASI